MIPKTQQVWITSPATELGKKFSISPSVSRLAVGHGSVPDFRFSIVCSTSSTKELSGATAMGACLVEQGLCVSPVDAKLDSTNLRPTKKESYNVCRNRHLPRKICEQDGI
eukprot:gb/GECG01011036.1/.p1 GENE.gb/GECG01011036.1/~~gb/GECG01011036.1/.p1  ORF type:complete len:110 (+),score=5.49 gb/GECG01011036.1/:1-330(+)